MLACSRKARGMHACMHGDAWWRQSLGRDGSPRCRESNTDRTVERLPLGMRRSTSGGDAAGGHMHAAHCRRAQDTLSQLSAAVRAWRGVASARGGSMRHAGGHAGGRAGARTSRSASMPLVSVTPSTSGLLVTCAQQVVQQRGLARRGSFRQARIPNPLPLHACMHACPRPLLPPWLYALRTETHAHARAP